MASSARIFTLPQLARHPDLSWRSQPVKRASEVLRPYADSFDRMVTPIGCPHRWRLSDRERRKRGIRERKVDGMSQRAEHWLGLGDIWCALAFADGRPSEWIAEWDHQFDVYCVWRGKPLLIEYQRTPITSKQWQMKWQKRREWYASKQWQMKPTVVLVDETGQREDTICAPRGTVHVRSIEELVRSLH